MRLTNSTGTDPDLDSHSAKRWSHGIGCIRNPAASLPEPLAFASKRFAVSRLELRIVDCSAPTGQPEYGESGPSSPAGSRSRPGQGQTGSGLACSASCLWASSRRTRRADPHAGERYCGAFPRASTRKFFRRWRRRRVCRAFGDPGSGPSQRRTVETLREKRWEIIEILVLPSFGAPLRCHPRWSVISWTGSISG